MHSSDFAKLEWKASRNSFAREVRELVLLHIIIFCVYSPETTAKLAQISIRVNSATKQGLFTEPIV